MSADDGIATRSTWLKADDTFLVRDRDGNGNIDKITLADRLNTYLLRSPA